MEKIPCDLSVVVPIYNEAAGLGRFHESLLDTLAEVQLSYEIIYVDDGSSDNTPEVVQKWHKKDKRVIFVRLSRNFGKESALSAGITYARGRAILMLDGDGQHPVTLIPEFIKAWQNGSQVIIGVRTANKGEGRVKRWGSKLFYRGFNRIARPKLIPGSSDFRLIDREVQQAFLSLQEHDRITRGLIDWLGFRRELIYFKANQREHGDASYDTRKLIKLAMDSFVSLSSRPLDIFGYLGGFIMVLAFLLGLSVGIEQILLGDPLRWRFTGTALLGILILFLVGLTLLSQWVLSLYVARIYNQSKSRPLFVINRSESSDLSDRKP